MKAGDKVGSGPNGDDKDSAKHVEQKREKLLASGAGKFDDKMKKHDGNKMIPE